MSDRVPASADPSARLRVYPVLTPAQCDRIRAFASEDALHAGDVLFERGGRRADLFVLLEGAIGIFHGDLAGGATETPVTVHRAGQFTGELDHVSFRALLVSARVLEPGRVLRVASGDVARLMSAEPEIGEILMRAFILRRMDFLHAGAAGITLIGPASHPDLLRLERFALRNGYPLRLVDTLGAPEAPAVLEGLGLGPADLPAVVLPGGDILRNPATPELADRLGLTEASDPLRVWDVVVVGAGPAGLATATYAASEGLSCLVIEALAPGGQAGTSSRIENYLGFPTGISGQALAARAQVQAQKFGARIAVSRAVTGVNCSCHPFRVTLEDGQDLLAATLVIASGARYRRLALSGCAAFEGSGIHYAATAMEAALCAGSDAVIVGGGNSAGQAAVYLSRRSRHVHVLVRGAGLAATMSDYLVTRIRLSPDITLHPYSEVVALTGPDRLRQVTWRDIRSGAETRVEAGNLFTMIGAEPNTAWLEGCLPLDDSGFVLTGAAAGAASPYATACPGIYAVGDVRSGSVKRVAASVGEGSAVVQELHRFLATV
ncbi:cyclic nucleotide-binding domain-containing protein (plasmid) [Paroceanicella profunda]|uniref:Thioredoxin reductase n=1 Tax=Paroceanicella profunda TaxID=2579971 RepID=A0A5B8G0U5_9RHOB|nr:FAD-dependent oxidoreductase [Paroceanicella profunda]QDL94335.1 cyclic nucleotide-binding domain-containing protein [Paroceanicella profunda]